MKFLLPVCLLFLAACNVGNKPESAAAPLSPTLDLDSDPDIADMKWEPVKNLSDEFNGTEVDLNKWQFEPLENDWGWIGRPPGLFQAKNVSIRDGNLSVAVGVLPEMQVIRGDTFTHYGGIVRSIDPGSHGMYYEAKMKANRTEMSSTFWIMSRHDCEEKQELDIQECVGVVSPEKADWVKTFDQIFHSNAIHRKTECNPEPTQIQGQMTPAERNWENFHVYGCWWKSPEELRFYFDGKYAYTINPSITFDLPAWIQLAIETYDWNPIPADGGYIKQATVEERRTEYDWVRVWRPASS